MVKIKNFQQKKLDNFQKNDEFDYLCVSSKTACKCIIVDACWKMACDTILELTYRYTICARNTRKTLKMKQMCMFFCRSDLMRYTTHVYILGRCNFIKNQRLAVCIHVRPVQLIQLRIPTQTPGGKAATAYNITK